MVSSRSSRYAPTDDHRDRDGMKACARFGNRTSLKSFSEKQMLCQGCVPSRLLFSILIARVVIVVLQRFNENADILTELMYLQEETRETRPESSVHRLRRAAGVMLYSEGP